MATQAERKVYSVAAFNRGVARTLGRLPAIWVEGEVSELRRNEAWATVFLTLKDPKTSAIVKVTIMRRTFDRLELGLQEGERVQVAGKPELYELKGELGLRATTVERVGVGAHLVALEELKRRLAAEGLFATSEETRTSPGSARGRRADRRRRGRARRPSHHDGQALSGHEGRRLRDARAGPGRDGGDRLRPPAPVGHQEVEVVVLARGGGSIEDLLPFSSEAVVRAVATCPVPVVSAVGHEQDTPLCDLAADVRAATPTAAAALVVPDEQELRLSLAASRRRLVLAVRTQLDRDGAKLARSRDRLRAAPHLLLERRRAALDRSGARLQALSPLATLGRGYAIVRADGTALRAAGAVTRGAELDIELASGRLGARVEEVVP